MSSPKGHSERVHSRHFLLLLVLSCSLHPSKQSTSISQKCTRCLEPVAAWDVEAVCAWAQENRIPEFAVLARSQDIDGPVLLTMQPSDFQSEPLAAALKEAGAGIGENTTNTGR